MLQVTWLKHVAVYVFLNNQLGTQRKTIQSCCGICHALSSCPDWWPKRCPITTCLLDTRYYVPYYLTHTENLVHTVRTVLTAQINSRYCRWCHRHLVLLTRDIFWWPLVGLDWHVWIMIACACSVIFLKRGSIYMCVYRGILFMGIKLNAYFLYR